MLEFRRQIERETEAMRNFIDASAKSRFTQQGLWEEFLRVVSERPAEMIELMERNRGLK